MDFQESICHPYREDFFNLSSCELWHSFSRSLSLHIEHPLQILSEGLSTVEHLYLVNLVFNQPSIFSWGITHHYCKPSREESGWSRVFSRYRGWHQHHDVGRKKYKNSVSCYWTRRCKWIKTFLWLDHRWKTIALWYKNVTTDTQSVDYTRSSVFRCRILQLQSL